ATRAGFDPGANARLLPKTTEKFHLRKVLLLASKIPADIDFRQSTRCRMNRVDGPHMLNQANRESTELLGDLHPLVQQLGSAEGLVTLSTASHSLQLRNVESIPALLHFLETYQAQILIPFELPAIQRAFRHASRNEARELISFDQALGAEPVLKPFGQASQRVGQAQIR